MDVQKGLKRFVLLFCFVSVVFNLNGQVGYDSSKRFTVAELKSDLTYLEMWLNKAHPGLYWHIDSTTLNAAFSALEDGIVMPMSEPVFLQYIGVVNDLIKCAHSDIRPSDNLNSYWKENKYYIPINIMNVANKYYVSENLSGIDDLDYGTEIIAINERPIQDIVDSLLPYIPADGDNQTRKYYALRTGFSKYYGFYLAEGSEFRVEYKKKDKIDSVVVKGLLRADFLEKRNKNRVLILPIAADWMDDKKIAILTVASFRHDLMESNGIDFSTFLKEEFKAIQGNGTEKLIIDLRGNKGGYSEYGAQLYAYLADSAFQYCERQILTSDSLFEEIDYDIAETFIGFPEGIIKVDEQYEWPNHSVLGWRNSAENSFKGEVYCLIDGGCASTTSEFASIFGANNRGVFIGEEVGGAYPGDSGGVLGWIELPNSKVRVRMGMVKYELAVHNIYSNKGVQPDYPVNFSIQDYLTGSDPQFNLALKLARQN